MRRGNERELRVLDGISFDVHEGEMFGVIGANGSGKTTLMRMLAGIYAPDRGRIGIEGKVFLVDMGLGFSSQMSARQNVIQNGVLLGVPQRELRRRFDEILEFAGLRDFADVPLMHFSSGMRARLAFSVMVLADGDVLLMDEVFAVGDAEFREKSLAISHQMIESGKTVVFVTHSMSFIERNCDRAMLLHHGKIERMGDTERGLPPVPRAQPGVEGRGRRARRRARPGRTGGAAERAAISELRIVGADGEPTATVPEGEAIDLRAGSRSASVSERRVCGSSSGPRGARRCSRRPTPRSRMPVPARGAGRGAGGDREPAGSRHIPADLPRRRPGPARADRGSEAVTLEFEIPGTREKGAGFVSLDHEVSFEREGAAQPIRT